MRKILPAVILCSAFGVAAAADLTVEIEGFEPGKGQVRVRVFDSTADFPRTQTQAQRVKADGAKAVIVFRDLPAGRYAVSAFHDENDNEKLDRGMFGIPKERTGFSQDARGGPGGPPEFRDAAFDLPADGTRVVLRLR